MKKKAPDILPLQETNSCSSEEKSLYLDLVEDHIANIKADLFLAKERLEVIHLRLKEIEESILNSLISRIPK